MVMMTSPAPDFSKAHRYPSGGASIGPAWQTMWDALQDGQWHAAVDLAQSVESLIAVKTAKGLLGTARRKGILEVTYTGNLRYSSYRLTHRTLDE